MCVRERERGECVCVSTHAYVGRGGGGRWVIFVVSMCTFRRTCISLIFVVNIDVYVEKNVHQFDLGCQHVHVEKEAVGG